MKLSEQLKLLANGINPDTGEVLEEGSLTNRAETVRMLFALAEELADSEKHKAKKSKLSPEERRQKNIAEGRPAKSHFPWDEAEKTSLAEDFVKDSDVENLSKVFERSTLAIAVQLQKMMLIPEEELDKYRQQ